MRDAARDPAALEPLESLERLRVQRSRLADRLRPPWWYLASSAVLWAVLFAGPFILYYLLHGVPTWPSLIGTAAETEALARSVADNGGVYLVPALSGLGAPWWEAEARGAISGLSFTNTKAHIVRAALEGMEEGSGG